MEGAGAGFGGASGGGMAAGALPESAEGDIRRVEGDSSN